MASKTIAIVGGIVCLTMFVLFILLTASIGILGYNEVGLNYSNWFKTIEEKTYTHGWHFIGLGHDFIKYDIKLSTLEFSNDVDATLPKIKCRT